MAARSLFDKYGGFAKVSRIVLSFYDRLLDSENIGPFFDEIDMASLVSHQTKFVASLLGGPASYTDEHLMQIHKGIDIKDPHFDEMKRLLEETLIEYVVDPGDIKAVLMAFEIRRKLIVN